MKGDTEGNDGILVSENFPLTIGCFAGWQPQGGLSNTQYSQTSPPGLLPVPRPGSADRLRVPGTQGYARHVGHVGFGARVQLHDIFFLVFPKLIFKLNPMFVLQLNTELCVPGRNHFTSWLRLDLRLDGFHQWK